MKCGQRTLNIVSLAVGLLATGALALAVSTDYWLYTEEPLSEESLSDMLPSVPEEYEPPVFNYTDYYEEYIALEVPAIIIKAHSGLWRMCTVVEGMAPVCALISYKQLGERVQGADTTWSILRAMRKASPVFVVSLVLLIIAFTMATLGNAKRDGKTISGAVVYIFSALILAVAVILYISAVNDEVSHRKKPASSDSPQFLYRYGWAFFCAGGAFVLSMAASVANITLYLQRYSRLEDMVVIIPGLHDKSNYDFSKVSSEDEPDTVSGSQNPTIIL